MGVSPTSSLGGLDCSLTVAGGAGAMYRAFSGSLGGTDRCVLYQVPMPAGPLADYGWDGQKPH